MVINELFSVTELSLSEHSFKDYHFCKAGGDNRKSRIGFIEAGEAEFMYLDQKVRARENDIIFIPEKFFCYSEWHGNPDISVFYLNFNIEGYNSDDSYPLQVLTNTNQADHELIKEIRKNLQGDFKGVLQAYSLFYQFLSLHLQDMLSYKKKLDKRVCKAIDFMTANWNTDFSMRNVAKEALISESTLYHLFREQLGQTPVSYLNAIKINYAIQYLENSNYSISKITSLTNFNSEAYFRRVFNSITGLNPSAYRKRFRLTKK